MELIDRSMSEFKHQNWDRFFVGVGIDVDG